MKLKYPILAAVVCSGGVAFADTEVHSVDYSYSIAANGDVYPRLRLPGFDDMNGLRELSRVDVRVQSTLSATLAIENRTAAPLESWSLSGDHLILSGFERENPKSFGPFAFLGGLSIEPITATLQPADGTPRAGGDYLATEVTTTVDSLLDMDPSYLPFFNGGGEVLAVVGPFTEFFLEGATLFDPKLGEGDATVEFAALSQAGTFSVIYEYTTVPEPTGLLAGVGLLATCRRRRGS